MTTPLSVDFGYRRPTPVEITDTLRIGGRLPLCVIAGPCVIESAELLDECAAAIIEAARAAALPVIFKASYDKANRTSVNSFRGPGLTKGLQMLADVKSKYNVPVLTDIHTPEQAAPAAEAVDILQIPAFLCRQTDILVAAAQTGKPVNVKKGQFISHYDIPNIIEKIRASGNNKVIITERGTSFGYRTLVNDFRALPKMRAYDVPVIFDATHSVQSPGGLGEASGGDRDSVIPLARAAVAVGVDGLFIETHPDPERAKSDGPNMLPLNILPPFFKEIAKLDSLRQSFEAARG